MDLTLVVMAAGMGSRYGGLKQIDPVGPNGELILDYSVYDAVQAGFTKVVFIIKEEMEAQFRELSHRFENAIAVRFAFQRLDDLPEGFAPPAGRVKPWGTGHAVYCARNELSAPFAVINADDFYGGDAFLKIAEALKLPRDADRYHCCMAGYYIENTMTDNGHVARGICSVDAEGLLTNIQERTHVEWQQGRIVYTEDGSEFHPIPKGTVVSMNLWGFPAEILVEFEPRFRRFLETEAIAQPEKSEFFLPFLINELIREGKADTRTLETSAQWYGVTYQADKEPVKAAIRAMVDRGDYPQKLWD